MKPKLFSLSVVATALVFGTAVPSSAQLSGPRKVVLLMSEYAYKPSVVLKVRKGETVMFTFVNRGKVLHEALIGTTAVQAAHEKEMKSMGDMAMPDSKDRVSVKPGATKMLKYTFAAPGTFAVACHQPNHYKLGMKVSVEVS